MESINENKTIFAKNLWIAKTTKKFSKGTTKIEKFIVEGKERPKTIHENRGSSQMENYEKKYTQELNVRKINEN